MKSKKWLIILVILIILIIGAVIWYFAAKGGQVSADSIEKWSLSPDTGISVNIADGVDEVKAGDILNYKIEVSYQGQKIASQSDVDKTVNELLKKLGLKGEAKNTQLVVLGYLATAKVKVTPEMVRDRLFSRSQTGKDAWLLQYPNFQMTVNKLKPNTSGLLTVPSVLTIPNSANVQSGKVSGNVYVYLTLNESNNPKVILDKLFNKTGKNVLVAKAIDTDELVSATTAPTQPGSSIVSLDISPKSPSFVNGGQQVAFTLLAKYSDGTLKDVSGYEKTQWEVITTKSGKYTNTIGEMGANGVFKVVKYTTPGRMRDFKGADAPAGKIKATFEGKSVETSEFFVLPYRSVIDTLF